MELKDQVAIVTGGSKGIGKSVAKLFAQEGAALVIVSRSRDALQSAAEEIETLNGGAVRIVVGDAADPQTAEAAVAEARRAFGGLNILANIAGAFPTALVQHTNDDLYQTTIASNLTATFRMCRAALPALRIGARGAIINMSSTAARLPTPGLAVYGASKAGIEAFTRALAQEEAPSIRVNAVSAGPTLTETVADLMRIDQTGAVETVTKSIPLGRLADTDEIAQAVLFLASSRASFITGQVLHANGGGIMA